MATQNKNVRMGERALEVLRALKYDLDASDGAIMEQALETRAMERLREHIEEVERIDRGLPSETRRDAHATAAQVLLTALNRERDRYRWADGRLEFRSASDGPLGPDQWVGMDAVAMWGTGLARRCVEAAVEEVRDLGCTCVDLPEAVFSLTRPASPGAAVLRALGVDPDALRGALSPHVHRGDLARDREVPFGARAAEALWFEPPAEAARLRAGGEDGPLRVQPEHQVLAALRGARGPILLALEAHAATYDLLRLRLAARPAVLPWAPDLTAVLVRAHALARRARRSELDPVLLLLALAQEGPAATPDLDHAALRDAAAAAELCRPAPEPLPASQPVALRDTFGHSIIVHEALRSASARARAAAREAVGAADACAALCALLEAWPVPTSVAYQQSVAALEAAGWRPAARAEGA